MPRQKFRTKQAQQRERVRLVIKTVSIFGAVGIFVGLVVFGSQSEHFRYKSMYVHTDGILVTDELSSMVSNELKHFHFGIWPKDSIILVPKQYVANLLSATYPRIRDVSVKRTGLYTLDATIEERVPVALWCGDVVPPVAYEQKGAGKELDSADVWGTCYLIDTGGYIYARAPLFSGNMFPRYYGSLTRGEPIAQQYIEEEEFMLWQEFYGTVKSTDDAVPQALLFVDERDIEVYMSNGLRILVPRKENPEVIKRRLDALFASEKIQNIASVEYVDLRFGNKAFIKYFPTE